MNKSNFGNNCKFLAGATTNSNIPDFSLPEIAFWGRSNVGKSSLINAVVKRRLLAKISNTPGRTRQINFFEIDESLILVDLPGYGYAKASKADINSWNRLIIHYLHKRPNLSRVCLLIDSRHELKDADEESMKFLDELAISYQIILTKCDKKEANAKRWEDIFSELQTRHSALYPKMIVTSAKSGLGIHELQTVLKSLR